MFINALVYVHIMHPIEGFLVSVLWGLGLDVVKITTRRCQDNDSTLSE